MYTYWEEQRENLGYTVIPILWLRSIYKKYFLSLK